MVRNVFGLGHDMNKSFKVLSLLDYILEYEAANHVLSTSYINNVPVGVLKFQEEKISGKVLIPLSVKAELVNPESDGFVPRFSLKRELIESFGVVNVEMDDSTRIGDVLLASMTNKFGTPDIDPVLLSNAQDGVVFVGDYHEAISAFHCLIPFFFAFNLSREDLNSIRRNVIDRFFQKYDAYKKIN